jgi:uncharacterized protein YkwD
MNERLTITAEDLEAGGVAPIAEAMVTITLDDLTAVPPQPSTTPDLDALETLMFNLVNAARREHTPRWLPTNQLKWHTGLAAVARGHSADMLKRQYVEHRSPDGLDAGQRISRYGIQYLACGENIGIVYGATSHGSAGIYQIQNTFLNQPRGLTTHRGNLLNPVWTHVGIGIAYADSGALVATQNFISTL